TPSIATAPDRKSPVMTKRYEESSLAPDGCGQRAGTTGILCLLFTVLCIRLAASTAWSGEFNDLRGRVVDVQTPVDSIAIDDGRFLIALALLHDAPANILAAWPRDMHRIGRSVY